MQSALVVILALHVLAAVFWAGSSFVIARIDGIDSRRLFASQTGAAALTILTGGYLWHVFHRGPFGNAELVLAIGIAAAGLALVLQIAAFLRLRRAKATGRVAALHYPAAGLLTITVIGMAIARFI
ncbi:hypothetical protein [Luteimonas salinilitoris]|uniref:Uncharacterized protein n=1 Tax=Luteimonas salinilitoris TaxID=3237697 RepID=A0ABV4HQG8_9GAMM